MRLVLNTREVRGLKNFGDSLAEAVRRCGNPVCVGLDPRWEQLPSALRLHSDASLAERSRAYEDFCKEIIDAVADLVPVVKPQAAFFEECGPAGLVTLGNIVNYASSKGLLVIMDGKRNDIGSTAEAYARGYLGRGSAWNCDALTISPYLGADSLEPFVNVADERGAGLFVLVKTSNPGSGMLQDKLLDGQPLYHTVANYVAQQSAANCGESGYGNVGAVVGATYPEQLVELRAVMPHTWFLVPGYGSQGGTAKDVAPAFDANGLGAIINNSRGINFAHLQSPYKERFGETRWQEAVAAATRDMIERLRSDTPAGSL
jgi:orotidine-5'-phosphate decarboxylase